MQTRRGDKEETERMDLIALPMSNRLNMQQTQRSSKRRNAASIFRALSELVPILVGLDIG